MVTRFYAFLHLLYVQFNKTSQQATGHTQLTSKTRELTLNHSGEAQESGQGWTCWGVFDSMAGLGTNLGCLEPLLMTVEPWVISTPLKSMNSGCKLNSWSWADTQGVETRIPYSSHLRISWNEKLCHVDCWWRITDPRMMASPCHPRQVRWLVGLEAHGMWRFCLGFLWWFRDPFKWLRRGWKGHFESPGRHTSIELPISKSPPFKVSGVFEGEGFNIVLVFKMGWLHNGPLLSSRQIVAPFLSCSLFGDYDHDLNPPRDLGT